MGNVTGTVTIVENKGIYRNPHVDGLWRVCYNSILDVQEGMRPAQSEYSFHPHAWERSCQHVR